MSLTPNKNRNLLEKANRILRRVYFKINKSRLNKKNRQLLKRYEFVYCGKTGIEIGGPSDVFNEESVFPVYKEARRIDGVNYRIETVWGKHDLDIYRYGIAKQSGQMFVAEGDNLTMIDACGYDFILSSHNLEHYSNPLKAIKEWMRVVVEDGYLVIVVPDKKKCFDHKRAVTSFKHLVDDYKNDVGADDMTHYDEVILKTDLTIYSKSLAKTEQDFKELTRNNKTYRCMHHHVFDESLLEEIADYFCLEVVVMRKLLPYHLFCIYRKSVHSSSPLDYVPQ